MHKIPTPNSTQKTIGIYCSDWKRYTDLTAVHRCVQIAVLWPDIWSHDSLSNWYQFRPLHTPRNHFLSILAFLETYNDALETVSRDFIDESFLSESFWHVSLPELSI